MRYGAACALVGWFAVVTPVAALSPPLPIAQAPRGVFHHLDGAGRKNIALSHDTVAVVWEDNRSGAPQVYAAVKSKSAAQFTQHIKLSDGAEAVEPTVVGFAGGFIAAWEQDGAVWLRRFDRDGGAQGAAVRAAANAVQANLAADDRRVVLVWSAQRKPAARIEIAQIAIGADRLKLTSPRPVGAAAAANGQFYPSVALTRDGAIVVAFEDRRAGHTRIYAAHSRDGRTFATARPVNESSRGSAVFGKGSGAARVALTPYRNGVAAVWLDKRNFQSGYDVFAAVAGDPRQGLGVNEKVQDDFGENVSQWHAAVAAHGDTLVAAWDDDRDETADVFLARRDAAVWSENLAVANGPANQHSPALAFDADGELHIVWVEQTADGGSAVVYRHGRMDEFK